MNLIQHVGYVAASIKVKRALWNIVCAILFRPFITRVFRKWRIFLLNVFGAKISYDANVYASCKIWAPWNLYMEKGACLGPDTICYNQAMVSMKENSTLSQYSYLCTAGHESNKLNTANEGLIIAPIILEKGAWVGTRAFIGMGVVVGENAIVGAAACVFRDVEPMTIVGGNPAKIIKKRELK